MITDRPHEHRIALLFVICLLAGLAPAGCSWGEKLADKAGAAREDGERKETPGNGGIRLTASQIADYGVAVDTAGPGSLAFRVGLTGEVKLNADRVARLVPRVGGIVSEVRRFQGDRAKAGEVLAVLESRELADTKAEYLGARERGILAQATFEREETLWRKKISSEQEYQEARQAAAEARIALNTARRKLHALGFSEDYLNRLPDSPEEFLPLYYLSAPFDCVVLEKRFGLGEKLGPETEAYVVADLRTVWVDFSVFRNDLASVRRGQTVLIGSADMPSETRAEISYVSATLDESTRTGLARAVLPNPEGQWRPGMFVSGALDLGEIPVEVLVPAGALIEVEGRLSVFVLGPDGAFSARAVTTGRQSASGVEITDGLRPGEVYVKNGVFTLKSEIEKASFEED